MNSESCSPPKSPSEEELNIVNKIRGSILDLDRMISGEYFEAKNLVRFIRARNGNLAQIELMIRKNVQWMHEVKIAEIFNWKPPAILEQQFPWYISGVDNFGGPVIIMRVGIWEPAKIYGMKDELIRYFLWIVEIGRKYFWARARSKGYEYLPQFSAIIDLEGLCWKHYMSYDGIQALLTSLRTFEANFPDTLRLAAAVNCPSIFSMFWKLMKPVVSPETHTKLRFLYSSDLEQWREVFLKYFPQDRFPEKYGGSLPDGYKMPLDLRRLSQIRNEMDMNGN